MRALLSPTPAQLCNLMQAITVINKLAVELDIDAAMSSVRQVALDLLECDRVSLFLIIDSRRELR